MQKVRFLILHNLFLPIEINIANHDFLRVGKIVRYFNHENYGTARAIVNVASFDVYLSNDVNSSELNSNDTSGRMSYAIVWL